MVQVDALRADHLGVYGYERDTTPELSEGGWLRVDGLSPTSSWTPLSVSSLMTSLPPYKHGIRYFDMAHGQLNAHLTAPRWSDAFVAAGIRSYLATGSNFVDASTGIGGGFTATSTRGKLWPENNFSILSTPVLDWLATLPPDAPFFVMIHIMNAHDPYFASSDVEGTWVDSDTLPFSPTSNSGQQPAQIQLAFSEDPDGTRQAVIDIYDEQILSVDQALSSLESNLSDLGLLDRSLLVLTADHGESLGDHDNGYFGHGNSLLQEQLHIPLLLKHPELPPGIVRCNASNMDTLPTLARMMAWPVALEAEGHALQDGCRSIVMSELYDNEGTLTFISASDSHYRLSRVCLQGDELANDLLEDPTGANFIDPQTIPEIDALRLSLDEYALSLQTALGSTCASPF